MGRSKQNPFKPFIRDFEAEAEKFLIKYGYEDALITPRPIDIRDIVTRCMSIEIVDTEKLSPDCSIQGIITFSKGIVQVYDCDEEEFVGYEVDLPTVFIDADITREGYINKLLAHEAFHWYKHRHYFVYQKTHNMGDGFAFRCDKRYSKDIFDSGWTDEETMEWQARKIAPMLLLPRNALMNKAIEIADWKKGSNALKTEIEKKAISDLAAFFHVTDYMIAHRLFDLGYMVSDAALGKHKNEVLCKKKYIHHDDNQSPRITLEEAFELYCENKLFREYIDSGLFRYRGIGFFSVFQVRAANIPDYLTFGEKLKPVKNTKNPEGVMFHQDQDFTRKKTFTNTPQNAEVFDRTSNMVKKFETVHARKAENAVSANEIIFAYMQQAKWNTSIFQEKTLLAPMDYTRVKDPGHIFKMSSYVAMAVGLGLTITEFQNVIRQAGMSLKDGDKTDDAYSFILTAMQGSDIDSCNDFLERVGVPKLGTHTRDWSGK